MAEYPTLEQWGSVGTTPQRIIGPTIASATTVAPTYRIHHVSGTTAIVNITIPWVDFAGSVTFIADAIWTWTAAGNIAVLGTVTAALGTVTFTYDPQTVKWYPSRVT